MMNNYQLKSIELIAKEDKDSGYDVLCISGLIIHGDILDPFNLNGEKNDKQER